MLPLDYSTTAEHKSFCAGHPTMKSCLSDHLSLRIADPLPRDELDAAKAAWVRDSFPLEGGNSCNSSFPRKAFVSEFVARDTGNFSSLSTTPRMSPGTDSHRCSTPTTPARRQ